MAGINPYTLAIIAAGLILITAIAAGVIGAIIDNGGAPVRTSVLVAVAYAGGVFTTVIVWVLRTS